MVHDDDAGYEPISPRERPTTPCPIDEGAHVALLEELDAALAIAKRSMSRIRIDEE